MQVSMCLWLGKRYPEVFMRDFTRKTTRRSVGGKHGTNCNTEKWKMKL